MVFLEPLHAETESTKQQKANSRSGVFCFAVEMQQSGWSQEQAEMSSAGSLAIGWMAQLTTVRCLNPRLNQEFTIPVQGAKTNHS